jgi:uncharacterized protein
MALKTLGRPLYLTLGWLSVGLGILGIVMPLFPTTPFLLVAVWAFSKSSPALAEKIRQHPIAGPYVRDWQDAGVIPAKAKFLAVTMMATMLAYLHFGTTMPPWIQALVAAVLAATSVYILTRPSRRPGETTTPL